MPEAVPQSPGLPRLLTPAEAAAALSVDPKTLARWAREGKIRHTWTPGRTRRYRETDVEAIIQAGATGAASQPGAEVLVVFRGVAEPAYRAGGHPDGDLVDMIPVRLPGGHLIYVPLVDGVAIGPVPEATET